MTSLRRIATPEAQERAIVTIKSSAQSFSTEVSEFTYRPASASPGSGHPATARVYEYTP